MCHVTVLVVMVIGMGILLIVAECASFISWVIATICLLSGKKATILFLFYLTDGFFLSRISPSFDYFFTGLCAVQFYLIIVVFPKSGSCFAWIRFYESLLWLQTKFDSKSMFIFILLAFTKVSIAGISADTGTFVANYSVHTFWVLLQLAFSPLLAFIYV